MKRRCFNPAERSYAHYGGRGITVCEHWMTFEGFRADMGERPEGKTLDRIDSNGNYEPANCRWATPREQRRNVREYYLTHCRRGHELTPENVFSHARGTRECRICQRVHGIQSKRKNRALNGRGDRSGEYAKRNAKRAAKEILSPT